MSASKEEKRARLLDVTLDVLGQHGIKKTNLEDIAQMAGMATTSLYYYFPNKNELVRAALCSLVDTLLAEVGLVAHSSSAPEIKLVRAWKVLFFTTRRSGLLTNLDAMTKSEVLHLTQDIVDGFNRRYTELIEQILVEGRDKGIFQVGNLETLATVLSVGVIGLVLSTAGKSQFDLIEGQIEELGKLIMAGLCRR